MQYSYLYTQNKQNIEIEILNCIKMDEKKAERKQRNNDRIIKYSNIIINKIEINFYADACSCSIVHIHVHRIHKRKLHL